MAASIAPSSSASYASSTRSTRWCGYSSSSRRPVSLRDVTASSSKNGWRSISRAASAPANPLAPRTATSATQFAPQVLPEGGDDAVAHGRDVLVGEGPVGRAELEVQGQRHATLPHLLAGVD